MFPFGQGSQTDPRNGQPYSGGRRVVNTLFPAVGMFLGWRDRRAARNAGGPINQLGLTGQPRFTTTGPGIQTGGLGGLVPVTTGNPGTGGPMPISTVGLTPQGNFQTTNPGITLNGLNLTAFRGGGPIGFSGGYTPSGASRIEGDAARDMWAGMQQGIFGNIQNSNAAR